MFAVKTRYIQDWGMRAKKALIDRNMSQAQLAKELGLSRPYVTSIINGKHNSDDTKQKICDYLGISSV